MSEEEKEPRYKDIEVPKLDEDKIPTAFLDGMSPAEQELIKKVFRLEQGCEFQMRAVPVRNWMIKDIDSRIQTLESGYQKWKPILAVVLIAIPVIVTSVISLIANKLF